MKKEKEKNKNSITEKKFPHYLVFIIIVIAGLIVYRNSIIKGIFFWDDNNLIIGNSLIKNFSHIKDIFITHIGYGSGLYSNFYRPLQSLSLMLDYYFWGLNPVGYHLVNVLIHILNSMGVYCLIYVISKKQDVSFLTALLFSVHTVLSGIVNYISARDVLLGTLFLLISMILYILYKDKINRFPLYFGSILVFILAILSREASIIFPFVILFYLYCFRDKKIQSQKPGQNLIWVFFIIIAIYSYLRFTVLNFSAGKLLEATTGSIPLHIRLLTSTKVFMIYLRLLLLPIGLHIEWNIKPATSFFQDEVFLSFVGLCIIAGFTYFLSRTSKLKFFAIGWFFIILIPYSNIYPLAYFMGEGWLYIPSIGFFALIAMYLSDLRRRSKAWSFAVILIACFMIACYGFLTIERNNVWSDPARLDEEALKYDKDNVKVIMNLGIGYKKKGDIKKAMEQYTKALELDPNYPLIYNNIGNIYLETGKYDDAIKSYKKAIELDPNIGTFYENLGKAYQGKNMNKEARDSFEKALKLNPNNEGVLKGLSAVK